MTIHSTLWLAMFVAACSPSSRHERADAIVHAGPEDDAASTCATAITGKVFAPNGTLPLYNVTVYIPVGAPLPFTEGVSCDQCATVLSGGVLVSTTTDTNGAFRLEGVPTDREFPVVVTIGKWRRTVTIPRVAACQDTAIPDPMLRLPRNREEGDLPRIALVSGSFDSLGCILPKLGVDSSEFGDSSSGPERIVFYRGHNGAVPGNPASALTDLWPNLDELKKFDMVINSCEGNYYLADKTAPDVMRKYADMGGRVFGSHFHFTWTKNLIPEWKSTASWEPGTYSGPHLVDTSFPKGMALAQWLVATGASTTFGKVYLAETKPVAGDVVPPTSRWLYSEPPVTTHYLSFDTPVGVEPEKQCGRVVVAGMHVAHDSTVNAFFPAGCGPGLTADEKAMVFLLFDLQACVGVIL
ncbi:MAG: carboxypeptidase-like regulatory domain-containing protein [Kofleriaceae bacterium]